MEIKKFSDLNEFVCSELSKDSEIFPTYSSKKVNNYIEKELLRYVKLYSDPLYKIEKYDLELEAALRLMPLSFWWKIFHPKTWKRVKAYLETQSKNKQKTEEKAIQETKKELIIAHPVVVKPVSVPDNDDDVIEV